MIDNDTGEAIGTELVRYGQRVTVIALPSPPIFLHAERTGLCRAARLRLRLRFPFGVRRMNRAGNRCRRHQHRRHAGGRRAHPARRQGADHRRRHRRHRRRDARGAGAGRRASVDAVMIGTTHFVNAVVQRRSLAPVAAHSRGPARHGAAAALHRLAGRSRRAGRRRVVAGRRRPRLRRPPLHAAGHRRGPRRSARDARARPDAGRGHRDVLPADPGGRGSGRRHPARRNPRRLRHLFAHARRHRSAGAGERGCC